MPTTPPLGVVSEGSDRAWKRVGMRGLRTACTRLGIQLRRPRAAVLALGLFVLGPLSRWVWSQTFGPGSAEGPGIATPAIGLLTGVYCGCILASSVQFVAERLSRLDRLVLRWTLVAANVAFLGACAWIGDAWGARGSAAGRVAWDEWALSTLLLSTLASALLPWCAGGRRSFLAVVAVVWWIPAVLPPSFLLAVPRALRGAFEGGRALSLPSDPVGWLADTALAAGLLLLAWAPRRATLRGDEVRHPG